jgi:uncharacterized protein
MTKDIIDYTALVDDAMHMIVKKSLEIFAGKESLGEHHFFISFITKYPGVSLSEKLQNKYPYEMTIVLQYQFESLIVEDNSFSVSLSFGNEEEKLVIPFAALTAFADPSVKFGLQFRHANEIPLEHNSSPSDKIASLQTRTSPKNNASTKKNKDNVIALDFQSKKPQ